MQEFTAMYYVVTQVKDNKTIDVLGEFFDSYEAECFIEDAFDPNLKTTLKIRTAWRTYEFDEE